MYAFLTSFYLFFLGLLFGSFVSAATWRIPRNISFVKGRSFCDSCKKNLYWYDNIPLFSYLFYLGKSRCCRKKISVRYPLIEITTALGFVVLYLLFNFSILLIIYCMLLILTLSIFVIDFEHQIIPDELSWSILFLALLNFSFSNIFSGFLAALFLLLLNLITKGRGMGLGDVKLAIGLGALLGLSSSYKWLIISFILGGIVGSILLLLRKANMKTKIAFGPFLIISFWMVILFL